MTALHLPLRVIDGETIFIDKCRTKLLYAALNRVRFIRNRFFNEIT